jgi:hypothetical protein
LAGSVDGFTHAVPHSVVPAEQAHADIAQVAPVGQLVLQLPQSNGSLVKSTHALAQLVSAAAHWSVHEPFEHT